MLSKPLSFDYFDVKFFTVIFCISFAANFSYFWTEKSWKIVELKKTLFIDEALKKLMCSSHGLIQCE
jgi:hypothetical protein